MSDASLAAAMAKALWDELSSPMDRWEMLEDVSRDRITRGMRSALRHLIDHGPTIDLRAAIADELEAAQ